MIGGIFSPEGRMRRRSYLLTILIINLLGTVLNAVIGGSTPGEAVIGFIVMMLILWPLYCAMSRRLHDADRTSTAALVALALAIGGSFFVQASQTVEAVQMRTLLTIGSVLIVSSGAVSLFILLARPTVGANRYGEDPRQPFIETPIDGPPPAAYDGV